MMIDYDLNDPAIHTGILRRLRDARAHAKKDKQMFNLDDKWFKNRLSVQDGLCLFSKRQMTWTGNHYDTVAIDRLDPFGSYTQDNVILCSLIVANMRNSYRYETTLKYSQAIIDHPLPLDDPRLLRRPDEEFHLVSLKQQKRRGSKGDVDGLSGDKND